MHTCASIDNDIRNECEATSVSVLKGHQLFTGVVDLDNELRTRMQNNQPLCDNVQMRKNREEVMSLLLRQIKTELKDMYGIDCSFSDFYSPIEESNRILLSDARRQIDLIIAQGLRYGDPAFVAINIERALFAKESPQTAMMNLIKRVSGIPQIEANFNATASLLTCAVSGNTVAAQYAWKDGRFPDDWRLSYSELTQRSEQKSKQIRESALTEEEKQLII